MSQVNLRGLLTLAWPIIVARATQSVVGFSDALMVAPLGEAPLAAATTGALNVLAVLVLPIGSVFILQSFVSQLRGRGDLSLVGNYARYGLQLAALVGIVGALAIPCVPWALSLFGYEPRVHALMSEYVSIRLLSAAAVVGMEALGNWYGGLGNTRLAMIAGFVTMISNVFLNYLLIEGHFGAPALGISGAAWASVIASCLGFVLTLIALRLRWGYPPEVASSAPNPSELLRVLRFGIPNGINWFLEFAAFVLFINWFVARLGTTALAAFNVVIQINSVSFMPAFGLSSAGAIWVGEAIGRRDYARVGATLRLTVKVAATWMVGIGCMYWLFPEALMRRFAADDTGSLAFVEIGVSMLTLSALWQLFDALGLSVSEALRAAGDTTWCMLARVLLAWFFFLPAGYLGVVHFGGGVTTVMLVLLAYIVLLSLSLALRFASGKWRSIELVPESQGLV